MKISIYKKIPFVLLSAGLVFTQFSCAKKVEEKTEPVQTETEITVEQPAEPAAEKQEEKKQEIPEPILEKK